MYSDKAENDIKIFKKAGDKTALKKISALLKEIAEHPRTGTGKPEFLKHKKYWSRRIDKEHRLCYEIEDDKVIVLVLSTYGHYEEN